MTAEKEISIWSKALLSILEKDKKRQDMAAETLVVILKKKKKEYLLPKILRRTEKAYLKKHKIEIFLAKDHSLEVIGKIKEKLSGILGEKKNIEVKTGKDLIGGFRIKTANFLIKASIKDFLDELKWTTLNYSKNN